MGFVEGRIKEEKVFGGVAFPKTLTPSSPTESGVDDLVAAVAGERVALEQILREHGAILFRGFGVESAGSFERVVDAFGWDAMDHIGATSRIKISDRVHTANEAPFDQFINFHNEMSTYKQIPSKIFFFCSQPSPEGGETSIVPSRVVVDDMEQRMFQIMEKFAKDGVVLRFKLPKDSDHDSKKIINKSWKWFFKTDDKIEAEKRARQLLEFSSADFCSDGSAEFVYGPLNPIREIDGKRVIFCPPILGYTSNIRDANNVFGDGSKFPIEALSCYQEILEDNCVDVKWEKGDVLLVDNFTVQHARRPGKPPRVILVSICK